MNIEEVSTSAELSMPGKPPVVGFGERVVSPPHWEGSLNFEFSSNKSTVLCIFIAKTLVARNGTGGGA